MKQKPVKPALRVIVPTEKRRQPRQSNASFDAWYAERLMRESYLILA